MKTYFRILKYVKKYWKHLSVSVFSTILYSLLNGATIYMTIPLLDTLFQQRDKEPATQSAAVERSTSIMPDWLINFGNDLVNRFNEFVFAGDITEILIRISGLILITFFLKNVFGYLQAYFLAFVEQGVIRDLRNEAYRQLHKLPMSFFKNERTGDLISRITNDVTVVQQSVAAVFLNLIREPLTILVFLGIALSISARLTLFSFIVLPFSIGIIAWVGNLLRKHSSILQAKMADITSVLQETISGVKIVKAFGMEDYEKKRFETETNKYFRIVLKIARIRNVASPLTEFLSVVVGVVIIYYGGALVLKEQTLKASEFLAFLFSIFQMMPPIKELSSVNSKIQESSAAADRIFEIIDIEPEIKDADDAISHKEFTDKLEYQNVSFHYDDNDELVLDNISFEVKKGEIVAFVGSSGAGKSTLIDLLPRFYDPTDGKILLDGVDVKKIKIKDLRDLMGIVSQETVLFNDTIRNNIAYGLHDLEFEKVKQAAIAANAHDFIMEFPKGYDTIIGERGTKLSGGQRQRISIARALLVNPPIMILDEATSSLDNESEALVQEAIEHLMTTRTTLVIAHRLSTIRNADKIIVIDKGVIVQSGKHDELMKDVNGIYRKLYELQFRDR